VGGKPGLAAGLAAGNKTREIVIALKRPGRITMTAADAARRGHRSSLDIKKSDRATLLVFIQRRPPAATLSSHFRSLSLSLVPHERGEPISRRVAAAHPRLLSSALAKTMPSTWRFRVIGSRGPPPLSLPPTPAAAAAACEVDGCGGAISMCSDSDTHSRRRWFQLYEPRDSARGISPAAPAINQVIVSLIVRPLRVSRTRECT